MTQTLSAAMATIMGQKILYNGTSMLGKFLRSYKFCNGAAMPVSYTSDITNTCPGCYSLISDLPLDRKYVQFTKKIRLTVAVPLNHSTCCSS